MTPSATTRPLVTVIMPTFNSARYLAESIESILGQTWNDLDLAILDGGSTDPTLDIARAYGARDRRVRVEVFPGVHPAERIDRSLPAIGSRYLAVQHSDDISYGNRIARQVQAFEEKKDLGVCGAMFRSFWHDRLGPPKAEGTGVQPKPEKHAEIKAHLLFWWVMHAPSLMYDREKILAANLTFFNGVIFCNDYWQTVTHIDKLEYYNVPEELSAYRLHFESDGPKNLEKLRQEELQLKERILSHFGFDFTPEELEIHQGIRLLPDNELLGKATNRNATLSWLRHLRRQNQIKCIFDQNCFARLLDTLSQRVEKRPQRSWLKRAFQREKRKN